MRREPKIFMKHILECIELIEYYNEDLRRRLPKICSLQDAIIRRIEIIGEAIKKSS